MKLLPHIILSIIIIITLLLIPIEKKLDGEWICVENCNNINTIHFYKDSMEINRYLGKLRVKRSAFHKIRIKNNTIHFENSLFYLHDRDKIDFHFYHDTLILTESDLKFVRSYSVLPDYFRFESHEKGQIIPPKIISYNPWKKSWLSELTEIYRFANFNGKPYFIYEGKNIELSKTEFAISRLVFEKLNDDRDYFEKYKSVSVIIDRFMKISDIRRIFLALVGADIYYFNLLYIIKSQSDYFPDNYIKIAADYLKIPIKIYRQSGNYFSKTKIINPELKTLLSSDTLETEVKIIIKKGITLIDNKPISDFTSFEKEINKRFDPELYPNSFAFIDSTLLKDFSIFLSKIKDEEGINFVEYYKREINSMYSVLNEIGPYKTFSFNHVIRLIPDNNTAYQEWLTAYCWADWFIDKKRNELCRKYFNRDFTELKRDNEIDLQIIKIIQTLLPKRIIPIE